LLSRETRSRDDLYKQTTQINSINYDSTTNDAMYKLLIPFLALLAGVTSANENRLKQKTTINFILPKRIDDFPRYSWNDNTVYEPGMKDGLSNAEPRGDTIASLTFNVFGTTRSIVYSFDAAAGVEQSVSRVTMLVRPLTICSVTPLCPVTLEWKLSTLTS
jgi:hypothetical protein